MNMQRRLLYAVAFQLGWFVCIMGGNIASASYAIIFLMVHLWLERKSSPYRELIWVTVVISCGSLIETLFMSAGFLYENSAPLLFERVCYPPLWLMALWLIFAVALRNCLAFLLSYPRLGYWMCCTLVPANYLAGSKLNQAIHINQPLLVVLPLIALIWVVFLACLIQIKRRYFEDMFNA